MILNSKQLEELEHLHDTVSEFDEEANLGGESEEFDEIAEGALAWRRGMLERAVATVKKLEKSPLSSKDEHTSGGLVFDTINNRYARVKTASKTQVELAYVSGGEGTLKGAVIQLTEMPVSMSAKKTKAEPKKPASKKPEPKKKEPVKKAAPAKKPAPKKPAPKKKAPPKKPAPKKKTPVKKPVPKKKVATKKPAPKKKTPVKKSAPKKKTPVKKPVPKKKAATKKPANINAFIKQNYRKMSNKELAGVTGLSEHTIRRKLGEWGLKRPGK